MSNTSSSSLISFHIREKGQKIEKSSKTFQFLNISRPHCNACNTLLSSKRMPLLNGKETDDSMKNLLSITLAIRITRSLRVKLKY